MSRTEAFDNGHGMEHHNVSEPTFEIPKHKVSEAIVHPEYHEEGERAHNVYVGGEPVGFVERKRIAGSNAWSHKGYSRAKWVWTANAGPESQMGVFKVSPSTPPSSRVGGKPTRKEAVSVVFADLNHGREHGIPTRSWEEYTAEDDY